MNTSDIRDSNNNYNGGLSLASEVWNYAIDVTNDGGVAAAAVVLAIAKPYADDGSKQMLVGFARVS